VHGTLTNLSAQLAESIHVLLNWENTITGSTLMEVERSIDGGDTFEVIYEISLDATSYLDESPAEITAYYRIKASNSSMSLTSNTAITEGVPLVHGTLTNLTVQL